MRHVTLLFLSMLLLAGCSPSGRSAPTPIPLDWSLKNGMEPPPLGSCPFPAVEGEPPLAANKDLEAILKIIASGKEGPKPEKERRSWWLTLVWEHTGYSPLRYYPSSSGNAALLQVPESLVTGSCHDGGEVVRVVPPALSKTIEHDLVTMVLELTK